MISKPKCPSYAKEIVLTSKGWEAVIEGRKNEILVRAKVDLSKEEDVTVSESESLVDDVLGEMEETAKVVEKPKPKRKPRVKK